MTSRSSPSPGRCGRPTPVTLLLRDGTAYVESAQACGHPLLDEPDPWHATTAGVGEAIAAASTPAPRRSWSGWAAAPPTTGERGCSGALGATADVPLDGGPDGLRGITRVDLAPARDLLDGVTLLAAIDVVTPLLGMFGATKTFGPQKGLTDEDIVVVDRILDELVVAACGSAPADRRVADQPGAGAAGGLGFALMLLGATTQPGVELVADAVGLAARMRASTISSSRGRAPTTTPPAAARSCTAWPPPRPPPLGRASSWPGQVTVGSREMRAMGVESAYAAADLVGVDRAMDDPHGSLAALAQRVARTWSPRR